MQLAFIGIGKMGRPMVERLIAAGHNVNVYNRSAEASEAVEAAGATAAHSACGAAADAELVMTALPTVDAVRAVYADLAKNANLGQIYIDHSTVEIATNRHCAELLNRRGAGFLDAPVSGGPAGAEAGTLTVMVGGDDTLYQRALPALEAFGNTVRLCGPIGSGQAVKLVNQLLVGIHTAAIAEATVLGSALGADPQVVLELIGSSFGGSVMLSRNIPRFISRDFSGATPVDLILKDLGIIHDEGSRAGVPMPLAGMVEQRFVEARSQGWGKDDMASLVKLWETGAGSKRD
ncbi:NAD(P)-dependent oxidoreductase [Rhodococcus globerulus]|uniref:NAD(P)-dependent oxidoreductase n=1 Tax=Rhodococcus globerulus TaxID=33008 RepID=A0ABU4C6A0_RHOGO|nr:NAD(P)-dependent oxidoreductase [Rhodococcus globerulus]MDV6271781.1 NAD(P)-dependent oxidoreductase [Rhodococcus globerulus]